MESRSWRSLARRWTAGVACLVLLGGANTAPSRAVAADMVLREALVLGGGGRTPRNTIVPDPVEAQVVAGTWRVPAVGDVVTGPGDRTRPWSHAVAGDDGWFPAQAIRGGYACFTPVLPTARILILNATGHSMAYVTSTGTSSRGPAIGGAIRRNRVRSAWIGRRCSTSSPATGCPGRPNCGSSASSPSIPACPPARIGSASRGRNGCSSPRRWKPNGTLADYGLFREAFRHRMIFVYATGGTPDENA